jgi:hypothetical protein
MRNSGWIFALCLALACSESRGEKRVPDAGEPRLPDKTAGVACKRDEDCPNGRCAKMLAIATSSEMMPAPGGYCTADCTTDDACGMDGECSVRSADSMGGCLASCSDHADCREGYTCVNAGRVGGISIRGTCQPLAKTGTLGDRVAGRACGDDAECKGGTCASATPLGKPFPGNYCTGRCNRDEDCGDGGACLVVTGSANPGHCYERCDSPDDCTRDGYQCRRVGIDFDACYPAADQLPDYTAGKACTDDEACGAAGDCARELPYGSLSAYEIVDAPGGYCTQECSLDSECGAGAQCISRGLKGGMCLANCVEESECREGYACIPHLRENDTDKICIPILR